MTCLRHILRYISEYIPYIIDFMCYQIQLNMKIFSWGKYILFTSETCEYLKPCGICNDKTTVVVFILQLSCTCCCLVISGSTCSIGLMHYGKRHALRQTVRERNWPIKLFFNKSVMSYFWAPQMYDNKWKKFQACKYLYIYFETSVVFTCTMMI